MPSVLLLNRYDRLGASSRLRFLDFLPALSKAGVSVTPAPLFDDDYLRTLYAGRRQSPALLAASYARRLRHLLTNGHTDLVWLEKEALPWLPSWIEGRLLSRVPYVMDLDDAWFHRYGLHRSGLVRSVLGGKLAALARGARLVIVGNDHLADWARASGARDVLVLPTVIDLERYPPPTPCSRLTPCEDRPFTIGWMGSPSSARYLDLVAGALARLSGPVRVLLVGAHGAEPPGLPPGLAVEHAPWREDQEVELLRRFDVGVMPLEDSPWARGKCGYKLIQYMAVGCPVVASPVGVNTTLVRDGENGFLALDEAGWGAALQRLADDKALRIRLGKAGRQRVEEHYSLQAVAPRLADALRWAASGLS